MSQLQLPVELPRTKPNRDIRSTELKRILARSSDHIHEIKSEFIITGEPPCLRPKSGGKRAALQTLRAARIRLTGAQRLE
jgi:hypothetical protein